MQKKIIENQQLRQESQPLSESGAGVAILQADSQLKDRLLDVIGDDSVTSFGRRCGLNEALLRKYLAGAMPSADRLLTIADTANVTVDWLVSGRQPKWRKDLQAALAASAAPAPRPPLDDRARLQSAVQAVYEGLQGVQASMSPEKMAELICASYDLITQNTPQARAQIARLIRLVA